MGRLVKEKGYHQIIPLMTRLPNVDLKIAGVGPFAPELRMLAAGQPNVHFLGRLDFPDLSPLYRNARAVIVPSVFYETFGYVVVEAFSVGAPVIVHKHGALPEQLSDITAVPVPPDPFTGQPFVYRIEDGRGVLDPSNRHDKVLRRYRLTLAESSN